MATENYVLKRENHDTARRAKGATVQISIRIDRAIMEAAYAYIRQNDLRLTDFIEGAILNELSHVGAVERVRAEVERTGSPKWPIPSVPVPSL